MAPHPQRSKPSENSPVGDLFYGTAAAWTAFPQEAFDGWLERHNFAASSKASYRSLWTRYIGWLHRFRIRLDRAEPSHIKIFLGDLLDVRLEQRERYHRVIERAYSDLMGMAPSDVNPASKARVPLREEWRDVVRNDDTAFLGMEDRLLAVNWIRTKVCPMPARPTRPEMAKGRAPTVWRHARDRCIAAVFLGGGVKLSELISLSVQGVRCIGTQTWITVAPSSNETRNVQLESFSSSCVVDWLSMRGYAPSLGNLLFPSAGDGRPLDVRTVRRIISRFFEGLNHGIPYTPQLLRNSFAAMLFERGMALDEVQRAMGYRRDLSAKRMRDAWQQGGEANAYTRL